MAALEELAVNPLNVRFGNVRLTENFFREFHSKSGL
jgi:hypothetical protein